MTIHLVINTVIVKQYFHFKANMLSLYKLSEFSNYKRRQRFMAHHKIVLIGSGYVGSRLHMQS